MTKVIDINNVSYTYKNSKENSLKNISLSVNQGETVLLCGESGSGKTSILRLINGLIPHYYQGEMSGEVTELHNFCFSYHGTKYLFKVKDEYLQLNIPYLEVPQSKIIAVVGENGAGKSTLLKSICGLQKINKAYIELDGKIYRRKGLVDITYLVMQDVNHQLFTESVETEILLSKVDCSDDDVKRIMEVFNLTALKDKHPMALSGGQKQRVAIASAPVSNAKILCFDEPTSGLDYAHMVNVANTLIDLKRRGKTIFVSTHDSELIELCADYRLVVNNGQVTLGNL